MNRRLKQLSVVAMMMLVAAAAARADSFIVTLDTTPLAGPQILAFGLTGGDGVANNTVVHDNFNFGVGAAIAGTEDCTMGGTLSGLGCAGDLSAGVTLNDTDFQAFFLQQFTPGASLSFRLTTTNNFAGGTPDQLAMYLCDGTFSSCYSDDGATGAMLLLDLTGGTLSPSSFTLFGAGNQGLSAPVVVPEIPEPSTLLLLGSGFAGIVVLKRKSLIRLASR